MKLKTQEIIRGIEQVSCLGVSFSVLLLTLMKELNVEEVNEIMTFLEREQIDLNDIRSVLTNVYMLDYFSSFRTQTLTSEYKELKFMYEAIIQNTSDFYDEVGFTDPVSIFAVYVYMYRKGYFSHEKNFLYSSDMKDFSKLSGLDVIRGRGVCRSISSMLTDIYREMGMSSYNLVVKASREGLRALKKHGDLNLETEKSGEKLANFVEKLTKIVPIANHMITMVAKDGKNYIFDPTNNGMLKYKNIHLLQVLDNEEYFIKNCTYGISTFMLNVFGHYSDGINIIAKQKQISMPTISYEEYEEIYLKTLKFCLENCDLFEWFYQNNKYLIEQIYLMSEKQNNLIKRLIPIIPNKKK